MEKKIMCVLELCNSVIAPERVREKNEQMSFKLSLTVEMIVLWMTCYHQRSRGESYAPDLGPMAIRSNWLRSIKDRRADLEESLLPLSRAGSYSPTGSSRAG
jgi:hypothetical protein